MMPLHRHPLRDTLSADEARQYRYEYQKYLLNQQMYEIKARFVPDAIRHHNEVLRCCAEVIVSCINIDIDFDEIMSEFSTNLHESRQLFGSTREFTNQEISVALGIVFPSFFKPRYVTIIPCDEQEDPNPESVEPEIITFGPRHSDNFVIQLVAKLYESMVGFNEGERVA